MESEINLANKFVWFRWKLRQASGNRDCTDPNLWIEQLKRITTVYRNHQHHLMSSAINMLLQTFTKQEMYHSKNAFTIILYRAILIIENSLKS